MPTRDFQIEFMYFVYLLQCADNSIYTGITTDLERRFAEHKNKKGGHYTVSRGVKKIIYFEKFPTKSAALKREAQIKSWRREKKLNLIDNNTLAVFPVEKTDQKR